MNEYKITLNFPDPEEDLVFYCWAINHEEAVEEAEVYINKYAYEAYSYSPLNISYQEWIQKTKTTIQICFQGEGNNND